MNKTISGKITVKDLKELLKDVDDDYIIYVYEEYYDNPNSFIEVDPKYKIVTFYQEI